VAVLVFAGLVPLAARAQAPSWTPADVLKPRPTFPGVDYDTPADQAAIAACKVENVLSAQKRIIGYALRDAQGKLLRRFVIAHGGNRLDEWSYYQDGFEVYREIDLNHDQHIDECRWLNAGGTRIALVEGGKITAWKQISPEEASKVLVQALVSGDLDLLDTVLATAGELAAAGLPKDVINKVATAAQKRSEQVGELQKSLVGWNRQTLWNRFDGTFPHVIPADAASGLEKDIMLYENAMIFPTSSSSQQDASAMAFLQVSDMIKLGATWKFTELPRAIDPKKPVESSLGGLRAALFEKANNVQPRDEAMDAALKALADFDVQNAPLLQSGDKQKIARYHHSRIPLLRAVVKVSKSPEDALSYNKQVVDSLIAALRTDLYPQAKEPLASAVADGGKLGSYAAYRSIEVEFAMKNDEPGANVLANQKKWMADLEGFLEKFPESDEAPDVLVQLASANEFNADEDKARKQYAEVVAKYSASEASKKAGGALRRLDLVGKPFAIKGTGLQGETVDTTQSEGKSVLVVFWASWASPVKADLPEMIKVYEKHHGQGLEIIGINLDNERADLDAFLKEHRLAWPQIYEPGGMESRLAIEYGIISLPTMFLVDAHGKVINRSLRTAAEVERQLEKPPATKQAGVALDRRD
jgi:thiol-disulfide isomerase/thioredoxin